MCLIWQCSFFEVLYKINVTVPYCQNKQRVNLYKERAWSVPQSLKIPLDSSTDHVDRSLINFRVCSTEWGPVPLRSFKAKRSFKWGLFLKLIVLLNVFDFLGRALWISRTICDSDPWHFVKKTKHRVPHVGRSSLSETK